ncbi:MAG: hypothetical protein AAGI88_19870 [Pseudomonadota bacterium]
MAYKTIDGVQYEKELLDLADQHTTGRGEGQISMDEAKELIASAKDGSRVTDTEMATLKYIRATYKFTDAAAKLFDEMMAEL